MTATPSTPKLKTFPRIFLKMVVVLGNSLTAVGFILLVLGALNVFNMDVLSFGLSSGIRIVGSIAISGCLLSAVGYGTYEYLIK